MALYKQLPIIDVLCWLSKKLYLNKKQFKNAQVKKILVIEDSKTMLKLISTILKKEGFEVFEAKNGWEGLEKANDLLPDLIVSDIIMPGLDGFNLLKQLKKYPLINKIPLIFLSGKDDVLSVDEGISLGASAFLTKPLDAEKFIQTINKMV